MQRLKDVWAETKERLQGEGGNEGPHLRLDPEGVSEKPHYPTLSRT